MGHIGESWIFKSNLDDISRNFIRDGEKNLVSLAKLVEKENMNDAVIDFLLCASDIGYTKVTNRYYKENPYAKREIIELAQTDKKKHLKDYKRTWRKNGLKAIMIMNGKMRIKNLDM